MANRLGIKTYAGFAAELEVLLKNYTKETIPPDTWFGLIDDKIGMLHGVLSTTERAQYKDRVDLVSTNYKGFTAAAAAGNTIDSTKKILHLDDVTLSVVETVAADMVNGKILIQCNSGEYIFESEIESVVFTTGKADVTLKYAVPVAYASLIDEFIVTAVSNNSDDTIMIAGETWYKAIDQILSIHSTAVDDECVPAKTISNFYGIKKRQLSDSMKNQIIWHRDGEYLMFCKGVSIASYGTRKMHFSRNPYRYNNVPGDLIDIPATYHDLLTKICMLQGLQTLQVPIPAELQSANSQVVALQAAKEKEIAGLITNQPDN